MASNLVGYSKSTWVCADKTSYAVVGKLSPALKEKKVPDIQPLGHPTTPETVATPIKPIEIPIKFVNISKY